MAILLLVVLAIINFIIYHKFFRVIYFGNMGPQLVAEMAMCFIVAAFELVILAGVLNTAVGAVGFVGGILLGIVKFIFKLILAGVIILVILLILSSMLPEKEDDKTIENSVAQNEVENEEIIKNEEIVEVKDISENESESQEQKDSEKKNVIINILKIIIIGVLIYCLIALFSNKEKNEEKAVNNNVVDQQSTETIVEENRDYEETYIEDNEVYEESYEIVEEKDYSENPFEVTQQEFIEESEIQELSNVEKDTTNFEPIGTVETYPIQGEYELYANENGVLIPYGFYQEILDAAYEQYGDYAWYVIFDLNKDGIDELIVSYGDNSAEIAHAVYSLDQYNCYFYGNILGDCSFYDASVVQNPNLEGMMASGGRQGVQWINYIFIEDNLYLYSNEIFNEEVEGPYIYEYCDRIPSFPAYYFSTFEHWGY